MAKTNDQQNTKVGPPPHRKASTDQNRELDRLKRDPTNIQKKNF